MPLRGEKVGYFHKGGLTKERKPPRHGALAHYFQYRSLGSAPWLPANGSIGSPRQSAHSFSLAPQGAVLAAVMRRAMVEVIALQHGARQRAQLIRSLVASAGEDPWCFFCVVAAGWSSEPSTPFATERANDRHAPRKYQSAFETCAGRWRDHRTPQLFLRRLWRPLRCAPGLGIRRSCADLPGAMPRRSSSSPRRRAT